MNSPFEGVTETVFSDKEFLTEDYQRDRRSSENSSHPPHPSFRE